MWTSELEETILGATYKLQLTTYWNDVARYSTMNVLHFSNSGNKIEAKSKAYSTLLSKVASANF